MTRSKWLILIALALLCPGCAPNHPTYQWKSAGDPLILESQEQPYRPNVRPIKLNLKENKYGQ